MSDRVLFVSAALVVIAAIATAAWLAVGGQLFSFDGLFLFCVCVIISLAYVLYLKYLVGQAKRRLAAGSRTSGPRTSAAQRANDTVADSGRERSRVDALTVRQTL